MSIKNPGRANDNPLRSRMARPGCQGSGLGDKKGDPFLYDNPGCEQKMGSNPNY